MLQAVYRVDNGSGWSKPWVELWNESTLPATLPGRVIGVRGRSSRQWLAKVTLMRRGSYRLGPLRVRTGDPFGLFTCEMIVGQPTGIVVFPETTHCRTGACRRRRSTAAGRPVGASRLPPHWSAASGPMSRATPSTASTGCRACGTASCR